MKRLFMALTLAAILACGGDGGSNPVTPPAHRTPAPFTVTGGAFDVVSSLGFDGCSSTTDWNKTYDLQIDSTNAFTMGSFKGTFTPSTLSCKGETTRLRTSVRNCRTAKWTEVQIKFTSADTFSGSIIYRYTATSECTNLKGCTSSWVISGTRVPTP